MTTTTLSATMDTTERESLRNSPSGTDLALDEDHYDMQEWCTRCAASDDPDDPGTPQLIVRERWDDWGVRGEAVLSCGHHVALDDSVSTGRASLHA